MHARGQVNKNASRGTSRTRECNTHKVPWQNRSQRRTDAINYKNLSAREFMLKEIVNVCTLVIENVAG